MSFATSAGSPRVFVQANAATRRTGTPNNSELRRHA